MFVYCYDKIQDLSIFGLVIVIHRAWIYRTQIEASYLLDDTLKVFGLNFSIFEFSELGGKIAKIAKVLKLGDMRLVEDFITI